jgi:hypothetical protein
MCGDQGRESIFPHGPLNLPGRNALFEGCLQEQPGPVGHALLLTASVQGQLALLVRLQWIAGQRAAQVMAAAPFAAVVVLTQRILWFERGEDTKPAQHHHAWVVFDHAHPPGQPPVLLYA